MAAVDIVFLALIAISSLAGFVRGFVKEALSLAAWVAAVIVAGLFSSELGDMMSGLIANPSLRRLAAFALLFVLTVFIGSLIGNLISGLTSAAGLRGTDRLLGGLFGVLRGIVILVLVVLLTRPFEFSRPWYQDSLLVPYVVAVSEQVQALISEAPSPDAPPANDSLNER